MVVLNSFYFFLLVSFFCAVSCVLSKNLVEVCFYFAGAVFACACLLLVMGSEFLALAFVLVYGGGIIILFLFAIMLLSFREVFFDSWNSNFLGLILFSLFFYLVKRLHCIISEQVCIWMLANSGKNSTVAYTEIYCTNNTFAYSELYTTHAYLLILAALVLLTSLFASVRICLGERWGK